jgi:hypothetical protein
MKKYGRLAKHRSGALARRPESRVRGAGVSTRRPPEPATLGIPVRPSREHEARFKLKSAFDDERRVLRRMATHVEIPLTALICVASRSKLSLQP